MRKVAIFDIDGTIFRSSLLIELVNRFVTDGIFPKKSQKEYEREWIAWLDREGSYEDYIHAVVSSFMKHIKGVYFADFDRISKAVVDIHHKEVYRFTRDLITELKEGGYFLLAVSHSPKGILDEFGAHMGFDKVYGMFYELGPTDRFTGNIVDEDLIRNKGAIVKRAVEKEGLTLKGSIGVGDTEGDIPMLGLVSTPICFNPNQTLYEHAVRHNWRVVVERKDVIYEIQG
jgi:HAD superfamily hydrolase (TIGR01490 family)